MDENKIALQIITAFIALPFLLKRWVSIERFLTVQLAACSIVLILFLIVGALVGAGINFGGVSIESFTPWFFAVFKATAVGFCLLYLLQSHAEQISATNKADQKGTPATSVSS